MVKGARGLVFKSSLRVFMTVKGTNLVW